MQKSLRIQKELKLLSTEPIPNLNIFSNDENSNSLLRAQIFGLKDTVYENGFFELEIRIPDRYPFEPPNVKFLTPIFHPNIDEAGRICLDLLKGLPDGAWKPSLNLGTLLSSVQLLIANPNLDDPLRPDVASMMKADYPRYQTLARELTDKHARRCDTIIKCDENNNRVLKQSAA